jgi:DNA mismatch repair protein MutS
LPYFHFPVRTKEFQTTGPMPKTTVKKKAKKETPLMGQYNAIKQQYPDAILLFRVGDFYETFGEDAIRTAKVLGIVLTKRANGSASEIELAGFPHHSLDTYMPKLVKAGHRVAICEQLEDPKLAKKIVKRGVTELITPGVAINDKILDNKENNYLASIYFGSGKSRSSAGIAFLDISTGEFTAAEGPVSYIDKLIKSFQPSEIIFSKLQRKEFKEHFPLPTYTFSLDDWVYQPDYAAEQLTGHFRTKTLKGFGIGGMDLAQVAAGACLHYLSSTENNQLDHIRSIQRILPDEFMWLDKYTIRNLELLHSPFDGGVSLLEVLDQTLTSMGGRLMRKWLALPLKQKAAIDNRLDIVEALVKDVDTQTTLQLHLKQISDLERLASKIAVKKIHPREVLQLKSSLEHLELLKQSGLKTEQEALRSLIERLDSCGKLVELIGRQVQEDAPALVSKGGVIAEGVSEELDDLRAIASSGKAYLEELKGREVERTGINSLKIGFNNVFGYYLEVRNTYKDQVPEEWIRKQTLVSAERYITPELKEYEQKIMGAEDKIATIEAALYDQLLESIKAFIPHLQTNAAVIARVDCLQNFAAISLKHQYRKPVITESHELKIKDGRHPVIEQQLPPGEPYVPNDVLLDNEEQQIIIITGPNMAGKSALLRQTALIVIMAQMGCFVPAADAEIGIVDKVFTRVGASDNLAAGESTFMVEMIETATIMNNISDRSLVLLDEIGRGTSTYDGISIAWSLVEYLHNHPSARAKTLFATHYHELNELEQRLARVHNFHVSTRESGNKVIFLRKLIPGGTGHSFGIHVAKMAGMPTAIVERANKVLEELEAMHEKEITAQEKLQNMPVRDYQLSIFQMDDPKWQAVREALEETDVNNLTPVEALLKLQELKGLL